MDAVTPILALHNVGVSCRQRNVSHKGKVFLSYVNRFNGLDRTLRTATDEPQSPAEKH